MMDGVKMYVVNKVLEVSVIGYFLSPEVRDEKAPFPGVHFVEGLGVTAKKIRKLLAYSRF